MLRLQLMKHISIAVAIVGSGQQNYYHQCVFSVICKGDIGQIAILVGPVFLSN